jgi:enediyne biosynthesis protein E4
VSQPCDRSARVPLPGKLDPTLKEFWSENPWEIVSEGHNLSAFERNRVWFNVGGKRFLDLSFLTGADSDGDGRGVVAADFRKTGQLDLLVRQVSGGPVLLFENQLPRRHSLTVSLRGTQSNKLGIGARLVARVGGRQIVRELYPHNGFRGQAPALVHFGLADATRVDRLEIRWPSGQTQVLTDLQADRHVVITEGKRGADAVEEVVPGKPIAP